MYQKSKNTISCTVTKYIMYIEYIKIDLDMHMAQTSVSRGPTPLTACIGRK